jgi:heavy metal translocating P-type ATPase
VKPHCDLCLSPIAETRTVRHLEGGTLEFCCPGCATVFEILGPEEARRMGPRFKGDSGGDADLPPGPYLELWLRIDGIACAACAPLVEGILQALPGVVKATVETVSEVAQVLYAPGRVHKEAIAAHCARHGFPAREQGPLDPDEDADPGVHGPLRLVLAIVLGANAMMNAMVMYAAFAHDTGVRWLADLVFMERIYDPDPLPLTVRNAFTLTTGLAALPVLLYCGWPIMVTGWRRIRMGSPNTDSLVGFGALLAFSVSLYSALVLRTHHVYFDTASMLVSLLVVGRAIEGGARRKARRAVAGLLRLSAPTAEVRVEGGWRETPLEDVAAGDRVRVRQGGRIPVDGRVAEGEGWADTSSLTGESLPVALGPGAPAFAGTLLASGTVELVAVAVGAATRLAQIVQRVRRTLAARAPIQMLADRIAAVFMPVVIALALLAGFVAYAGRASAVQALMAGVAVLVVACPCALGLATPMVLVAAVAECARRGILLKGGEVLEKATGIKALVLDKTGTLTTGRLDFTGARCAGSEDEPLALAAALEEVSVHPLAERIFREGATRAVAGGPPLPAVEDRVSHPGLGVAGTLGREPVLVGRPSWLKAQGVTAPEAWWSGDGLEGSLVMVARGGVALALWGLGDSLRPEAPAAVAALGRMGISCWLVSGDRVETCLDVAARVGIPAERVVAGALPIEKGEKLAWIQQNIGPAAMVGDGVNDAVALSQADLGIAMGNGAGVALETAGVVLVHRDLRRVPAFLALSRLSMRRIRQNLGWALVYNALLVPLALTGHIHPILAATAMMASSISVVVNSGRKLSLDSRPRDLETVL